MPPATRRPARWPSATPSCWARCGGRWRADVRIGGEAAPALPIQLIDEASAPTLAVPTDCSAAANGGVLDSPASLQANGVLGIGMVSYDCGLNCASGNYGSGHVLYYSCPNGSASCVPAAVPGDLQMQNPVAAFLPDADGIVDNNGSVIMMPAVPDLGASVVRGRLVFGIGTRANNQIPLTAHVYPVDTNPANDTYLSLGTSAGGLAYPSSYIDSGSNAMFFDDPGIRMSCQSSSGSAATGQGWYCPPTVLRRTATITAADGSSGSVDFPSPMPTCCSAAATWPSPTWAARRARVPPPSCGACPSSTGAASSPRSGARRSPPTAHGTPSERDRSAQPMNYLYVYDELRGRACRHPHPLPAAQPAAAPERRAGTEGITGGRPGRAGVAAPGGQPGALHGLGLLRARLPGRCAGVVRGKAVLINASACIGHGACLSACPVEAISLVFGTEKRGIDIPNISPEFETNVPGIYIAGELGGMGLIRKAAEQGRQAIEAIRKRSDGSRELDVLIVGCGPAGLSAGLSAIHHKLRYRIIEQEDSLGGAVYHYPRNKITMTAPVQLAIVGKVKFGEVSKGEAARVLDRRGAVDRAAGELPRAADRHRARRRRLRRADRPRALLGAFGAAGHGPARHAAQARRAGRGAFQGGVPAGRPRAVPHQKVLVVGGGDSALEAAIALAEQPGTRVTLSYRSAAFSRVRRRTGSAWTLCARAAAAWRCCSNPA